MMPNLIDALPVIEVHDEYVLLGGVFPASANTGTHSLLAPIVHLCNVTPAPSDTLALTEAAQAKGIGLDVVGQQDAPAVLPPTYPDVKVGDVLQRFDDGSVVHVPMVG